MPIFPKETSSNLCLLSRQQLEYKTGPTRMWDYGGSQDDGDDELPLEVLQDNAEDMLDNTKKSTDHNNAFGIGSSSTTILENELDNLDYQVYLTFAYEFLEVALEIHLY